MKTRHPEVELALDVTESKNAERVRTLSPTGVGFILPYWKVGFSLVWGMDWEEEAMASDSSRFTSSQLDTQR